MALPNSELPPETPAKKAGGSDVVPAGSDAGKVKHTPDAGTGTALNENLLPDWNSYLKLNKPTYDPTLLASGNTLSWTGSPYSDAAPAAKDQYAGKVAGANDFIGNITGNPDATDGAADWLFGKTAAPGDVKVAKKAPDGTPVTVDASKTAISADAGVAHIDHSVKDGTNIYRSDNYVATDVKGLRTITDVKSGYTVQWDSTAHKGEMFDKDHHLKMKFNSEDQFNANVEHMLTKDRGVSQFTNKEAMDGSVQAYLDARKKGTPSAQGEHIFVDSKGDYSIVAKDGVMYEYDKASGKVFATRDGKRVEIDNGATYQDVSGQTTVQNGVINLGATKLDTAACTVDSACTLTTQSDSGAVTVTGGQGQSKVTNPDVVATTLTDKGTISNGEQKTQGVFSQADTQGNVSGHTADGASYNFGSNDYVINEPNGQYTLGNDNGSISTYAPDGTPLIDIDPDNGVSALSQPLDGWDDTRDADGDYDGAAVNSSPVTASTAMSTFASAGSDLSMVDAHVDPGKAGDLSSRLMNDYASLNDFAASATARGLGWAANLLQARAASVLEAANKLQAQNQTERSDGEAGVVAAPTTPRRRDSEGFVSNRTVSLDPSDRET